MKVKKRMLVCIVDINLLVHVYACAGVCEKECVCACAYFPKTLKYGRVAYMTREMHGGAREQDRIKVREHKSYVTRTW